MLVDNHRAYLDAVIELTKSRNGPPTRKQVHEALGRTGAVGNWDKSIRVALIRDGYLWKSTARHSPLIPRKTSDGVMLALALVEVGDG